MMMRHKVQMIYRISDLEVPQIKFLHKDNPVNWQRWWWWDSEIVPYIWVRSSTNKGNCKFTKMIMRHKAQMINCTSELEVLQCTNKIPPVFIRSSSIKITV